MSRRDVTSSKDILPVLAFQSNLLCADSLEVVSDR